MTLINCVRCGHLCTPAKLFDRYERPDGRSKLKPKRWGATICFNCGQVMLVDGKDRKRIPHRRELRRLKHYKGVEALLKRVARRVKARREK